MRTEPWNLDWKDTIGFKGSFMKHWLFCRPLKSLAQNLVLVFCLLGLNVSIDISSSYGQHRDSKKVSVNLTAGSANGGAGDVASNLLMALWLANHSKVRFEVRFWVEKDSKEALILALLLPPFNPRASHQAIRGIHFFSNTEEESPGSVPYRRPPEADYFIGYSLIPEDREGIQMIDRIANSKMRLLFYRNDGNETEPFRKIVPGIERRGASFNFILDSGANGAGYYVLPTFSTGEWRVPNRTFRPRLESTGKKFIQNLKHDFSRQWNHSLQPDSLIAFAYAHHQTPHQIHQSVIAEFARRHPNSPLVYVTNAKNENSESLPPNVTVLTYEKLNFEFSRKLIHASLLPPLVSGDVSSSLALNSENVFFIENLPWRAESNRRLAEIFETLSTEALKRIDAFIWRWMLNLPSKPLSPEAIQKLVGDFFKAWDLEEGGLQETARFVGTQLRAQRSLLDYTTKIIATLQRHQNTRGRGSVKEFSRALEEADLVRTTPLVSSSHACRRVMHR